MRNFISIEDVLNRLPETESSETNLCFGENIDGNLVFDDISHLKDIFVAGQKGSGKSVLLRSLILNLMVKNSPEDIKFILIDIKNCDLVQFNETPHLYLPLINKIQVAKFVFDKLNEIIKERFELCSELEVSSLREYNLKIEGNSSKKKLPKIIVVIDELCDLLEVQKSLLWPLSFGASMGIHFIIASNLEKFEDINNIVFDKSKLKVLLKLDDEMLVKKYLKDSSFPLLGNGDCLIKFKKEKLIHAQTPYSDGEFIDECLNKIKKKYPNYYYDEAFYESIKKLKIN